jgi:hypothetical protein
MGAMRAAAPYQLVYLVAAMPVAALGGWVCLAYLALIWAMSWPLLYFAAALGLLCSVRSGGSWQALAMAAFVWAGTLLIQMLLLSCVTCSVVAPLLAAVASCRSPDWKDWEAEAGIASICYLAVLHLLVALVLYVNSQYALRHACDWIEEHERVREPEMAAPEEPE